MVPIPSSIPRCPSAPQSHPVPRSAPMVRFDLRTRTVATLLAVALAAPGIARAAEDFADIKGEIAKRHDESVQRLQEWIALPSIAAESLNSAAGAERMAPVGRDAGFQKG